MKKLCLMIMLTLLFFSCQITLAQIKEIQIMYFTAPPLIILDENTGEISGVMYDLIENYIAKEMDVKFVWGKSQTPVQRQISLLQTKSGYASAVLIYAPERVSLVNFTEKSYVETKPVIAVLKSSRLDKVNSVSDILDLRIGYGQGNYISPFMKNNGINLELLAPPDYARINLMKLINNRINAAYLPNHMHMLYEIRQAKIEDKVKILDLPDNKMLNYVAFSKSDTDIVAKYNNTFNKIDGRKIIKQLLKKYIDISQL